MYHVLLVSDNRLLLKQLYQYLENEAQLEVLVAPFSSNTYEKFIANKSDLVVFDADNMIPFKKILEQLTQSPWGYRVIVLNDRAEARDEHPHVIFLEKKHLNRQTLIDTLMKAAQMQETLQPEDIVVTLDRNGQIEFIPYPDAYFILLAKYLGKKKEPLSNIELTQLKTFTLHAGEVEIISVNGRDLILSMRRTKMRSGFEFSDLAKIIFAVLGNEYAIFFRENIHWTRLNQAYAQLTAVSGFGYFLAGESLDVGVLNKRMVKLAQNDVHDLLWKILSAALWGKSEDLRFLIKDLYLHQLKFSLDVYMVGYTRQNLSVIQNILSAITLQAPKEMPPSYPAIEQEYLEMENVIRSYCDLIRARSPLNPIVIKAITKIYRCYPEEISLKTIAHELSVNKIYLGRLFREQTGMTILDLLQAIRYEIACYLLQFSTLKIAAVAKAVGYSDPGYFCRIFKKRAGTTPEEYRILHPNREKIGEEI